MRFRDYIDGDLSPENTGTQLRLTGYAARCGVFSYTGAELGRPDLKTVRVLVTPEVLFDAASLATLGGAPVTVGHPPEWVGPANYTRYAQGHVSPIIDATPAVDERDYGYVRVRLFLGGDRAIKAATDGNRQLSLGYDSRVDWTAGHHPIWGDYDARQLERVYNHVSLEPAGRHGPQCSVVLDSAEAIMSEMPEAPENEEKEVEAVDEMATLRDRVAALEAENASLKEKLSASGASLDAVTGELTEARKRDALRDAREVYRAVGLADGLRAEQVEALDVVELQRGVVSRQLGINTATMDASTLAGHFGVARTLPVRAQAIKHIDSKPVLDGYAAYCERNGIRRAS